MLLSNILSKGPKGLWSVTYLVILINDNCRDSFVNYFRKYSGFMFSVFLAGFLSQENLVACGRAKGLIQTNKQNLRNNISECLKHVHSRLSLRR